MENRSLVTIANHSKERILYLLEMAREFEKKPNRHLLDEKIVATLFFEPSTRTRLSFETAANRLGAKSYRDFTDPKGYKFLHIAVLYVRHYLSDLPNHIRPVLCLKHTHEIDFFYCEFTHLLTSPSVIFSRFPFPVKYAPSYLSAL